MYIKVTQDGIVRLDFEFTEAAIEGLYTEGLETCIGLIFTGDKGISFIHDTGRIQQATIQREAEWVGKIKSWAIVLNPKYREKALKNFHRLSAMNILPLQLNELEKCDKCFEASEGFVSVKRDGFINTKVKPKLIDLPLDEGKRHWINILNNYFHMGDLYIPGDLQFDGKKKLPCKNSLLSVKEMLVMATNKGDQFGIGQISIYLLEFDLEMYEEFFVDELVSDIVDSINSEYGFFSHNDGMQVNSNEKIEDESDDKHQKIYLNN